MAKYEIEIWGKNGKPLGDIRQFCSNLSWSKALNDVEVLSFDIDLYRYEELLAKAGYKNNPFGLLDVGSHDVRIKRNGNYLIGANIIQINYASDEQTVKMAISAYGYLNYYKTRFITADFEDTYQEDIIFKVIDMCNRMEGGDYGVRPGVVVGGMARRRDRHYERKEVKNLFQQLSEVIDGPDFSFTPDKKLNVYSVKGQYRPGIRLTYPGNIQSFDFNRTIDRVSNAVISVGSGNGDDALISMAEDARSANRVYRREKITTYNSVSIQNTLDEHCKADLANFKDPIELPSITVGDGALDLNLVDVGDVIQIDLGGNLSLAHVNGDYRLQGIDCAVDDNDSETVTLTFDDINVDEIIKEQKELAEL